MADIYRGTVHDLEVKVECVLDRSECRPLLGRCVPVANEPAIVRQNLFLRDIVVAVPIDVDSVFLGTIQSHTALAATDPAVVSHCVELGTRQCLGRDYQKAFRDSRTKSHDLRQLFCKLIIGGHHRNSGYLIKPGHVLLISRNVICGAQNTRPGIDHAVCRYILLLLADPDTVAFAEFEIKHLAVQHYNTRLLFGRNLDDVLLATNARELLEELRLLLQEIKTLD